MRWLKLIAAPSRIEVLRVLFSAQVPLRIRTIASLTEASLRPIQLALPQLVQGKLITRKKSGGIYFYEIGDLPYALERFLKEINQEELRSKAEKKNSMALNLGHFQEDAFRMIRHRKSKS